MLLLQKVVAILSSPTSLIVIILVFGALLGFTRWRRPGRAIMVFGVIILAISTTVPIGRWLVVTLENRISVPASIPKVDGIVILGGFVDMNVTDARGQMTLNDAIERVTGVLELARQHPHAPIIISGGHGVMNPSRVSEAELSRSLLGELGLDTSRLRLEAKSRTTRENAVLSRELARPRAEDTWVLVTSAVHMPRALGAFRGVGWHTVPYPVDYRTDGQAGPLLTFRPFGNLAMLELAAHEWRGLVYYRLRGWIPTLFPAPAIQEKASKTS